MRQQNLLYAVAVTFAFSRLALAATGGVHGLPASDDSFSTYALVSRGGSDDALRLLHVTSAGGSKSTTLTSTRSEVEASVQSRFSLVSRSGHGLYSGDEFSERMCAAGVSAYGNKFGLYGSRGYDAAIEVMGDVTTVLSNSISGSGSTTLVMGHEASDSVSSQTIDRADFSVGPTVIRLTFTALDVEAGIDGNLSCSSNSGGSSIDMDLRAKPGDVVVTSSFTYKPSGDYKAVVSDEIELGELRAEAEVQAGNLGVSASVPFEWDAVVMNLDLMLCEWVHIDGGSGTGISFWDTIVDRDLSDLDRSGGSGLISH